MDYTLSRVKQGIYNLYCVYYIHYKLNVVCITAENCVSYNNLELLPWLFEGKGDNQFDGFEVTQSSELDTQSSELYVDQ